MRHRRLRSLALLATFVMSFASLAPLIQSSTLAQDGDLNLWENETYGITIGWTDDWTVDADEVSSDVADGDLLNLTSADATLTLRAVPADLTPVQQLELELTGISYLNGSEPEIIEDGDTSATAEIRSDSLSRLVSVIAPDSADGLLIATLVADSSAFDDAIASASESITVNDAPLLAGDQDEPTEEATEKPQDRNPTEEATDDPEDLYLPTEEPLGDGVDGTTYTSPNYGYSLEWDEDTWQIAEDGEISESGYDLVTLTGQYGGVSIYAFDDYDGDPERCLEGEADYSKSDPSIDNWEPAENADGDPIAGATEDTAYALFTASLIDPENENAPARSLAVYLECRSIGDESILGISAFSLTSQYNDHIDEVIELTDTITLYGEDSESEPSETPDDITNEEIDPPAEDDEATEEATEESEETPEDGGDTVDGSLYTSPGFGFTVDIPATWAIDDEIIEDGSEQLILYNGTSIVTVWATSDYGDGTLSECVTFAAEASGLELELDIRIDGSPFRGADDLTAFGAFVYMDGDTEFTYYIQCSWIEEDASALIIIQNVPTEDYATERRFRRQIENNIDLP